jgi:hypothetical protein
MVPLDSMLAIPIAATVCSREDPARCGGSGEDAHDRRDVPVLLPFDEAA